MADGCKCKSLLYSVGNNDTTVLWKETRTFGKSTVVETAHVDPADVGGWPYF